ncbi:hypothetical protein [Microlunatus ginsengisoli]|uniref:Metallo-beta-lactamase superfamily protein n=1 Tax=Microlunatus ginsengisoli TaxID=363863 RepID=A0ABP7ASU7_9ACTN
MSPTASALDHAVGDVVSIDDRTVLMLGQDLDVAANRPDIANVLLHRFNRTLFMIDTGATVGFRRALKSAVDLLGPWDHSRTDRSVSTPGPTSRPGPERSPSVRGGSSAGPSPTAPWP